MNYLPFAFLAISLLAFAIIFVSPFISHRLHVGQPGGLLNALSGKTIEQQLANKPDGEVAEYVLMTSTARFTNITAIFSVGLICMTVFFLWGEDWITSAGVLCFTTSIPVLYLGMRYNGHIVENYFRPSFDAEKATEIKYEGRIKSPRVGATAVQSGYSMPRNLVFLISFLAMLQLSVGDLEASGIYLVLAMFGAAAIAAIALVARMGCSYHYSTDDDKWSAGYTSFQNRTMHVLLFQLFATDAFVILHKVVF